MLAFQLETDDYIKVGEYVYLITGEPVDYTDAAGNDWLHFPTTDEEDEFTELPFGPFQTVEVVVSFEHDDDSEDDLPGPDLQER